MGIGVGGGVGECARVLGAAGRNGSGDCVGWSSTASQVRL